MNGESFRPRLYLSIENQMTCGTDRNSKPNGQRGVGNWLNFKPHRNKCQVLFRRIIPNSQEIWTQKALSFIRFHFQYQAAIEKDPQVQLIRKLFKLFYAREARSLVRVLQKVFFLKVMKENYFFIISLCNMTPPGE